MANKFQMKRMQIKKLKNINTSYLKVIRKQINYILFSALRANIDAVIFINALLIVVALYPS